MAKKTEKKEKKEKKVKKRRFLSSYEIEQDGAVEKLSDYYGYDRKKKIFEIPLHYEKASELYFDNVEFREKPNISDEATDNMVELLQDIPEGYKAEFSITIDDYEGVEPERVMEGINDALSLRHLRFIRENTGKGIKIGFLMFMGVTFILLKTYGILFGWWGEGNVASDLFTYVIDIFGCVLIWECVYGLFVDRSEEIDFERAISKKVHSIKLYDERADKALSGEDSQSLTIIMGRNRKKLLSNRLLLLSGFSLLAIAVADILWTIANANSYMDAQYPMASIIIVYVTGIISALITAKVGMTAIKIYKGTFRRNIEGAVITIAMIILLLGNIITMRSQAREVAISTVFKIIVELSFVVGLAIRFSYFLELNRSYRKKNKK